MRPIKTITRESAVGDTNSDVVTLSLLEQAVFCRPEHSPCPPVGFVPILRLGTSTCDTRWIDPRAVRYLGTSERQQVSYTLVVEANGYRKLPENRYQERIAAGGIWTKKHSVSTILTGERTRLEYMLYVDDLPAEPMLRNGRTEAHLWGSVTETESPSNSE